jgi:hypothetical protein
VPEDTPPPKPEVLPAPSAPKAKAAADNSARSHWALTLWWAFKKLAWRNTAAGIWILVGVYWIARFGLVPQLGDLAGSAAGLPSRAIGVAFVLWLLLICELQLTQVILFGGYLLTLPLWLPIHGFRRYRRGRAVGITTKSIPFKIRPLRLSLVLVLLAAVLWWPLPSPRVALVVGVIALLPGFYLARMTFRFAIAPASWMRELRSRLHKTYEEAKNRAKAGGAGTPAAQQAQVATREWIVEFYEQTFPKSIERGLLRTLVIANFCVLLVSCLVYLGFLGALWLRGLTVSPEQLAAAIGRVELPNLVHFTLICTLGVLGEWRIDTSGLPGAAAVVVYTLNIARVGTSIILSAVFFSNYSVDIRRAETGPTHDVGPPPAGGADTNE